MTRIVGGIAGGRRLVVPAGQATRPTSDRTREGLFSTLEALVGSLVGARVLDLYAGSGAVGLEALSRGAEHALLVESDPSAVQALRRNIAALRLPGAEVRQVRAERLAEATADRPGYDLVFADPPYLVTGDQLGAVLSALAEHAWVIPDAIVVVERSSRDPGFVWPVGFRPDRSRRYGETCLWYGRAAGNPTGNPTSHLAAG